MKNEKHISVVRLTSLALLAALIVVLQTVGKTMKVLVDGREGDNLTARTEGGRLVRLPGPDSLIGQFINARITGCTTWSLVGEVSD